MKIEDQMRAMFLGVDTMIMDENMQIHGMYRIQDMKGTSMHILKIMTQDNVKKLVKTFKVRNFSNWT